jgi:hypothetical protein
MLFSWFINRREAKARAALEAELLLRFMTDRHWQEANIRAKDMSLPQEERVRALAARWEIEQRLNEESPTGSRVTGAK